MISRFQSFVVPVALVAVLLAFTGCAGSKKTTSGDSGASAEPAKNQKLEDARRAAEDAEAKAHQLREEKNSSNAKSGK